MSFERKRKSKRAPRPKLPSEVPLDEGSVEGTDAWREIDGLAFCHWDRWLLRLSLDEPEGLASIAKEFRRRARGQQGDQAYAEAMLAQVADLEARLARLARLARPAPLARLGRAPGDVLEPVERESRWLRDKAFRRVWHATTIRCTAAMLRTPRNLLGARARHGHWPALPVSPSPWFVRLDALYRGGYHDEGAVGIFVLRLELEGDRMLAAASGDDERLAMRRAILGACIEAMDHVDDSGAELAQHFREQEQAYLTQVLDHLDRPAVLRDLLELATWEDYGLFHHIEAFLKKLPEPAADLAVRELAQIIADLRDAELEDQLGKARRLRQHVLQSATAHGADADPAVDAG